MRREGGGGGFRSSVLLQYVMAALFRVGDRGAVKSPLRDAKLETAVKAANAKRNTVLDVIKAIGVTTINISYLLTHVYSSC